MSRKNFFYIFSCLLMVGNANSAEYHFTPGINLSTIYTDNVFLVQEEEKESDIIYEVTPQFQFTADGRRMDISASYSMQVLEYDSSDNEDNTINHQLSANTNIEVIRDNLFLDANVTRNQSYIDYNKPVSENNYAQTDNRTDITTYRVTPKFQTHLWDNSVLEASKTFTRLEYDDVVGEERQHKKYEKEDSSISSKTIIFGGDTTIGLNYVTSNDEASGYEYTQKYISLTQKLVPTIKIYGNAGKETTNRENGLVKNKSDYYLVGFSWNPNRRSKIDMSYGERAHGITNNVEAIFSSKRKTIGFTYTKDLTSVVDQYAQNQEQLTDAAELDLTERFFVSERYQVFISKSTSKSTFTVKYYEGERGFENVEANEEIDGNNFSWIWKPTIKTTFSLNYSEDNRKYLNTGFETKINTRGTSFTKKISKSGSTSISYSKTEQELASGLARIKSQTAIISVRLLF